MLNTNKSKEKKKDDIDHRNTEIEPKIEGTPGENSKTTINNDLVEADVAPENEKVKSKDDRDKPGDKSIEMPDVTYDPKNENVGMPEDNGKPDVIETEHGRS